MALSAADQMGQAVAYLAAGQLVRGWRLYEARWAFPDYPGNHIPVPAPRATAMADFYDRRVLLWYEQSAREIIPMLRFIPAVTRVARSVVLVVQPELKNLIPAIPGLDSVITDGDAFTDVDCHCPLMSLPFLLRTRLATIPTVTPYLQPPADRVAAWRERLGTTRNQRVGLFWRADPNQSHYAREAIPASTLFPLPRLAGFEYHVLQNHLDDLDHAFLASTPAVRAYAGELNELADVAALAVNLDMIVTVDSVVAHLAGALGVPAMVALTMEPSWIWMTGRDDSPWYPTARLFRQQTHGDWSTVISRIRGALWQKHPSIEL